jgi:hypothetical protein
MDKFSRKNIIKNVLPKNIAMSKWARTKKFIKPEVTFFNF